MLVDSSCSFLYPRPYAPLLQFMVYISENWWLSNKKENRKRKKSRPHLTPLRDLAAARCARSTRQRSSRVFILPVYIIYYLAFTLFRLQSTNGMASLKKKKKKKKKSSHIYPIICCSLELFECWDTAERRWLYGKRSERRGESAYWKLSKANEKKRRLLYGG